jgi:hypothetical protein
MPKCKHCAHPYRSHGQDKTVPPPPISNGCWRCFACHGYEPARGIRQKRRTPAAALKLTADGLWSKVVHARPDGCEIQHYREHECKGGYQAMHGIPRTYNATRHLPINGFKGCAAIHKYYTEHPEEWSWVTLKAWGGPAYLELWETARAMQPVDLEATVAKLKAELAERTQERSA